MMDYCPQIVKGNLISKTFTKCILNTILAALSPVKVQCGQIEIYSQESMGSVDGKLPRETSEKGVCWPN